MSTSDVFDQNASAENLGSSFSSGNIVLMQPEDLSKSLQLQQQQQQQELPSEETPTHSYSKEEESSPFISHPSSPMDEIMPQETSSPSLTARDSYAPPSISNLEQSLAEMKVSAPEPDILSVNHTITDISNDDILTINNSTPSRNKSPRTISPWRQIRPSVRTPEKRSVFQNKPDLKYGMNPLQNGTTLVTSTNSTEEEYNRKLLDYKIEIKFLRKFLHELLDKYNIDESDIERFFKGCSGSLTSTLEIQHQNLQLEYNDVVNLNNDLYENLSTFEKKLMDKENQIKDLHGFIDTITFSVDGLIRALIEDRSTIESSREALEKSLESPLEARLNVIKFELLTRFEKKSTTWPTPPSTYGGKDEKDGYINTVEELLKTVDSLESQCRSQKLSRDRLEQQLLVQIEESNKIKSNFQIMSTKFNQLRQSLDNDSKFESQKGELEKKVLEYEKMVPSLQNEIQRLRSNTSDDYSKIHSRSLSIHESSIMGDYLQLQNAYAKLNQEFNDIRNEHKSLQKSSQDKISNLTTKLHEKSVELRTQLDATNKLRIELDSSLDKQRKYNTERIQMSYSTDALKKENEALQSKIAKLTDLMTLTVDGNTTSSEAVVKKLSVLEFQYKDLLLFDAVEFKKLIDSYNKIADDKSLHDPKTKYEKLYRKINEMKASQDHDDVAYIRDKHKSIFEYFIRATDILVNDHVRLLLKENDNEDHKKLKSQVEKLTQENESLKLELAKEDVEEDPLSPISKLRMNDLRNKWKAERERRILEDQEAKKRFKELESEIARLNEVITANK
ncbi:hypothetical protein G210_1961 [Candida maltosa Xu316]|uniref:Mto2p-binding domain-containing protein n=1 Tax=Candida maltosa (strain Xu316) TaxID=1245528 RepID=M3HJT4_CANMX|nr:hypothetical protein G210_1961 [Candida maltosa Xu316]